MFSDLAFCGTYRIVAEQRREIARDGRRSQQELYRYTEKYVVCMCAHMRSKATGDGGRCLELFTTSDSLWGHLPSVLSCLHFLFEDHSSDSVSHAHTLRVSSPTTGITSGGGPSIPLKWLQVRRVVFNTRKFKRRSRGRKRSRIGAGNIRTGPHGINRRLVFPGRPRICAASVAFSGFSRRFSTGM